MTAFGVRIPNSPHLDSVSKVIQVCLSLGASFRSKEMYSNAFWSSSAMLLSLLSFASRRRVQSSDALKLTSTTLPEIEFVHCWNVEWSGESARESAKLGSPPRILTIRCESREKFWYCGSSNTLPSNSPPSFKPSTLAVTSRTKLLLTSSYLFEAQACYLQVSKN